MNATTKPNLTLPSAVLELGRLLANRFDSGSKAATEGITNYEDVTAKTTTVLSLVRSSPYNKMFGIGSARLVEDALRLRVIALLGWRIIGESQLSCSLSDIAVAVMDGEQEHYCRQLLRTRDCISGMIDDKLVLPMKDFSGNRGVGLGLPLPTYGWLCGSSQTKERSERNTSSYTDTSVPTAKQLYDEVRQKVIGCDPQIRTLASRISLAVARADLLAKGERDSGVGNQVILVYGSSGVGKTFVVEELARASNLVFASFDASGLSGSGWAGSSVDDALKLALTTAKNDTRRASRSIVCFDEIDKVLRGGMHEHRQSVQADLLRPLGGHSVIIGGKKNFDGPPTIFDCAPTTFILSGVFDGLEELSGCRKNQTIGFQALNDDRRHANFRQALEEYGCIPEVCGRVSAFVRMPDPSAESIARAIVSEQGIIAGYNSILMARNIVLFPQPSGVDMLANYGLESKTFFRGVKHVLGTVVEDILFNDKQGTVFIDANLIRRAIDRAGGIASAGKSDSVDTSESFPNDGFAGEQQVAMARG